MLKLNLFFIFASLSVSTQLVFAEYVSLPMTKTIVLQSGSEHEETLPEMPARAQFSGDFRNITQVAVAREYKKIKFSPYKTGNGTFTVYGDLGKPIFEYRIVVQ